MTTVLIADDQALVRVGLRKILGAEPETNIVGEAGDGEATATRATAPTSLQRRGPRSRRRASDPLPQREVVTMNPHGTVQTDGNVNRDGVHVTPEVGSGIDSHANTNADIAAARAGLDAD
jgi:hypothetical protein